MIELFVAFFIVIFCVIAIYSFFKMISIQHDFLERLETHYPELSKLNFPIIWNGKIFSGIPFKERLIRGGGLYTSIGLSIFFPIANNEASKAELYRMRNDKVVKNLRRRMTLAIIPSVIIYSCLLLGAVLFLLKQI